MVVSATLGAGLVLLAVLSEALGGFLWRDELEPAYHCPDCQLTFSRYELPEWGRRRCPQGHRLRRPPRFSLSVVLATACITVIAVGLVRIGTGLGM